MKDAAFFLDYENIAITADETYGDDWRLHSLLDAIFEELRTKQIRISYGKAFADFSYFQDDPHILSVRGIDAFFCPGKNGADGKRLKNSSDIAMCIDAMEVLFTRPEISYYVIGGGDRDYIPLINRLRSWGKTIIVVSFEACTANDLKNGCDEFVAIESIYRVKTKMQRGKQVRKLTIDDVMDKALEIIWRYESRFGNAGIKPLLQDLSAIDNLPIEMDPKVVVEELAKRGEISIEKKTHPLGAYEMSVCRLTAVGKERLRRTL